MGAPWVRSSQGTPQWPSCPSCALSSVSPSPHSDTLNIVASDHRPFSTKQKAMGKEDFTKIPHGVSGVQDRMNIIWERGVVRGPTLFPCVPRRPQDGAAPTTLLWGSAAGPAWAELDLDVGWEDPFPGSHGMPRGRSLPSGTGTVLPGATQQVPAWTWPSNTPRCMGGYGESSTGSKGQAAEGWVALWDWGRMQPPHAHPPHPDLAAGRRQDG